MALYLKLGRKATSFVDMATSTIFRPGEIIKVSTPSWKVKEALKGGGLVKVTEEEYLESQNLLDTETDEEPETDKEAKTDEELSDEDLLEMTRKEIMAKYDFLDKEDLEKAESLKTKAELVEFLRSIEKDY